MLRGQRITALAAACSDDRVAGRNGAPLHCG